MFISKRDLAILLNSVKELEGRLESIEDVVGSGQIKMTFVPDMPVVTRQDSGMWRRFRLLEEFLDIEMDEGQEPKYVKNNKTFQK